MGLDIKKNKRGQYQIKSTVSNERLHEKLWVTEAEAKKVLIERAYFTFIKTAVEIGMTFPAGYMVDGKREDHNPAYNDFAMDQFRKGEDAWMGFMDKFDELRTELNLDI